MEINKDKVEIFKIVTDGLFRKLFALIIVIFGGSFLFDIAMQIKGEARMMIIGSVITIITSILSFYYGTSQSSQDKDKRLEK